MLPLTVLLIGDGARPEFLDAAEVLQAECDLLIAGDINRALTLLMGDDRGPEVILLAQERPGQFSLDAVAALRERWPLARLQALLGPWCDGETRSGRPWPAVTREYWHTWLAAWHRERQRRCEGKTASWALPVTATDDERLLRAAEDPLGPQSPRPGIVALATADFDAAECLGDVLRQAGYQPLLLTAAGGRIRGAAAGLWDGRIDLPDGRRQLADFADSLAPAPVLALMNFPRSEQVEAARAAGAIGIVSKPYLIDDLLAALRQAIEPPANAMPLPAAAAASTTSD